MEIFRKSGVAGTFTVPLIDTSKRPSYKLNPTIVAGDVKVIRHTGGAWDVSDIVVTPGVIPGSTSNVLVELTDVELTPDDLQYPIIVQFIDQTAIKEWDDQTVIIWTQEIASDLSKINGDPVTDNSATLKLKQLDISNENGDAVSIYSKNKDAIRAESVHGSGLTLSSHVWYGSEILTSPDGVVWADSNISVKPRFTSIAYNGTSLYVGVCLTGEIFNSSDGIEWVNQNLLNTRRLNHVIWDGTKFVAVGEYGWIFLSSDGVVWTQTSSGGYDDIFSIVFNGSLYLLLVENNVIYSNTDFTPSTWAPHYLDNPPQGTYNVFSAAWSGAQFVAVSGSGGIFTSVDGLTWVTIDPPGAPFTSIVWDGVNAQFVAVGYSSSIFTSPDGSVWTQRTSGLTNYENLWSITWNGSLYTVVGELGTILTSDDGIDWIIQSSGTDFYFVYVIWDGVNFIAVGSIAMPNAFITKPALNVSSENISMSPAVYIKGELFGLKIDSFSVGVDISSYYGINVSALGVAMSLNGISNALSLVSSDTTVNILGVNKGVEIISQAGPGMRVAGGGGAPALKLEGDPSTGGIGLVINGYLSDPAVLINAGENAPGILINGGTVSGNGIDVVSPNGHGVNINPGATYNGIHLLGGQEGIHAEGTNHGIKATSAGAPLSGAGFLAEGGGGPGIEAVGDDGHPGIYGRCIGAGQGAKFVGNGGVEGVLIQGASEADGLKVSSGATSGFGIRIVSPGGHGISVTSHASYNAVDLIGGLVGLYAKGTNHGAHFTSVDAPLSGAGLLVEGGGGPGLEAIGDENFPGIHAHSVGGTGHGILAEGINGGCGLKLISGDDGFGAHIHAVNSIAVQIDSDLSGGLNIQGPAFGATIMAIDPYTAALHLVGGVRVLGGPELPAVDIQGAGTNSAVKITSGGDGIEVIGAEASYDINAKELKGLLRLDSPIDSVPTSDVLELVLAMVNGRFVKDPEAGTITFYKRDNNAVLFTVEVSETERARL